MIMIHMIQVEQFVDKKGVIGGQFGLPDEVRRGSSPERPVEAGQPAYLRRVKVAQHGRYAALRHVPQTTAAGILARRRWHVGPHLG